MIHSVGALGIRRAGEAVKVGSWNMWRYRLTGETITPTTPVFFVLNKPAWRLEFKVFTTRGELVRSVTRTYTEEFPVFRFIQTGGFTPNVDMQWDWDGRNDKTGERVAHGAYQLEIWVTIDERYIGASEETEEIMTHVAPVNMTQGCPPGSIDRGDGICELPPPEPPKESNSGLLLLVAGAAALLLTGN